MTLTTALTAATIDLGGGDVGRQAVGDKAQAGQERPAQPVQVAHAAGVGAFAQCQLQGIDQDRFAGPGLAAEHAKTGR